MNLPTVCNYYLYCTKLYQVVSLESWLFSLGNLLAIIFSNLRQTFARFLFKTARKMLNYRTI